MSTNANPTIITILTDAVISKSGTKNGKDWSIREQEGVIEAPDRKQPVSLALGNNAPYPPGRYALDLVGNLNVSQFGSIGLRRELRLTPIKA